MRNKTAFRVWVCMWAIILLLFNLIYLPNLRRIKCPRNPNKIWHLLRSNTFQKCLRMFDSTIGRSLAEFVKPELRRLLALEIVSFFFSLARLLPAEKQKSPQKLTHEEEEEKTRLRFNVITRLENCYYLVLGFPHSDAETIIHNNNKTTISTLSDL